MAADQRGGESDGGLLCQFVEIPPKLQLECPVCLLPVREPHMVNCCGYRYCKTCIEKVLGKGRTCPLCRETVSTILYDKLLKRTMDDLEIYCLHKNNDCTWIGELRTLDKHLNSTPLPDDPGRLEGCQIQPIKCKYCSNCYQRGKLGTHEETLCPQRPVICMHCNKFISLTDFDQHTTICDQYPVLCPNSCGETVKRSKLDQHVADICPQTIIECECAHAGCKEKLPRVIMSVHLSTAAGDHVQLLLKALSDQKLKQEAETATLLEKNFKLQVEVDDLQKKLIDLEANHAMPTDKVISTLQSNIDERDNRIEFMMKCIPVVAQAVAEIQLISLENCVMVLLAYGVTDQMIKSLLGKFGKIHSVTRYLEDGTMALVQFVYAHSVDNLFMKYNSSGIRLHGQELKFVRLVD